LTVTSLDYLPNPQVFLGIGTAMTDPIAPATVRIFCPSTDWAGVFARRIGELGIGRRAC